MRGEVMGINSSIEALAQGIPAVISGYVASIAFFLPTVVSAALLVMAGISFLVFFKPSMVKEEALAEASH